MSNRCALSSLFHLLSSPRRHSTQSIVIVRPPFLVLQFFDFNSSAVLSSFAALHVATHLRERHASITLFASSLLSSSTTATAAAAAAAALSLFVADELPNFEVLQLRTLARGHSRAKNRSSAGSASGLTQPLLCGCRHDRGISFEIVWWWSVVFLLCRKKLVQYAIEVPGLSCVFVQAESIAFAVVALSEHYGAEKIKRGCNKNLRLYF